MKSLDINKGQFFEDILTNIPNKTILYKTLTGIGATSLMLKQEIHHAIIIVPNVPVIKGKCKKMNGKRKTIVKGVYEGVTIDSISEYLSSNVPVKKFITTPEGYVKIREAIAEHEDYDLIKDFFILFDECERLVQDVSYREKMLVPIEDFFKAKMSAMISATPIEFTEPRFKAFKKQRIQPTFDYKQDLLLLETNNIELTLRKFIDENPRERYFIFHNSTDSIAHLIKALQIEDDSIVFCSQDSVKKLKGNDIKEVYSDLQDFKKYNFLTSRFFSAVDIEFREHPTIIMLTDLYFADHSSIDPHSEAIQIIGRFRDLEDFKPVKEVIHITNLNRNYHIPSREDILKDVEQGQLIHRFLKTNLNAGTSLGAVRTLEELIKKVESNLCITEDSTINYFFLDNRYFEEKVKEYYTSITNLLDAYVTSTHFNIKHNLEEYTFTDKERVKLLKSKQLRLKTIYEILLTLLETIDPILSGTNPLQAHFELEPLRKEYGKHILEIESIGYAEVRRLHHNPIAIRKAISEKAQSKDASNFKFVKYLERHFIEGNVYTSREIKRILKAGIEKYKLFKLKPTLGLLKDYFHLGEERVSTGKDENGRYQKGYIIGKRKLV